MVNPDLRDILKSTALPNPFDPKIRESRIKAAKQRKFRMANLYAESVSYLRDATGIDDVEIALKYLDRPVVNAISRDLKREQEWYGEVRSTYLVSNIQELYTGIVDKNRTKILLPHARLSREYIIPFSGECADNNPEKLSDQTFGPLSISRE
jgi:hypothetical protein